MSLMYNGTIDPDVLADDRAVGKELADTIDIWDGFDATPILPAFRENPEALKGFKKGAVALAYAARTADPAVAFGHLGRDDVFQGIVKELVKHSRASEGSMADTDFEGFVVRTIANVAWTMSTKERRLVGTSKTTTRKAITNVWRDPSAITVELGSAKTPASHADSRIMTRYMQQ